MGFWDFGKSANINAKVQEARSISRAVIVDVREPHEYEFGHIAGAVNLPVNRVGLIRQTLKGWLIEGHERRTPLYVYCASGARSKKAAGLLRAMGFDIVEDMGGCSRYTGLFEKGPMPESPVRAAEEDPENAPGTEPSVQTSAPMDSDAEDPRADALIAALSAELADGSCTIRRFPNADAAKVYLFNRISSDAAGIGRGILLYTTGEDGGTAEVILTDDAK